MGKEGNGALIDNAYTTAAYTAAQFESAPKSLTDILTTNDPSVPVTNSVPGQAAQLTFNGSITINGASYILTTTRAGQTTLLGFNGAINTQPILAIMGTSSDVNVTVHEMNGSSVQSVIIASPDKAIFNTLASNGPYYLEVSPRKTGVYSLILSTFMSGTLPLDGAPLSVPLLRPGQYAYYTFAATAQGKPLYASIDGVAGSAAARLYLYAPGNDLPFSYLHFTAGQAQLPTPVLPATGAYTMLIVPDGIGTGAYTVTLKTR